MALVAILVLYAGIGVLAAIGTVAIFQRWLSPRAEHSLLALILIPIASLYLAFVSYFHATEALPLEGYAVLGFAGFGLVGLRWRGFLILGYSLHGFWDLIHEVAFHTGQAAAWGPLTTLPLAYGAFCATYDWAIAWYLASGRSGWLGGWLAGRVPTADAP